MTLPILQTLTLNLKHAYEQLLSPIWVFDIDHQGMVWANRAAVKLWQADSLESLLKHDFASGMSEATHTRLIRYLEKFKSGGDTMESWTFYPGGKAKTVRCHCSGVLLEEGRLVMLIQASIDAAGDQDISAVRGVEALRHTSVMITLCTEDGDALTENPAAFRSYSFTGQNNAAKHAFLDRFADQAVAKEAAQALQRDSRFSGEVRMLTSAGEHWHSIDAFRTTDPATGAPAILLNESNITRMMLAEQRVRAAHDELEETVAKRTTQLKEALGRLQLADRMASVGTLAAGVAHEVNNPLTFVMSNLELLRDALDNPKPEHVLSEEDMAECSADALAGAERIKRIVRDLSTFSRGSAALVEPIDLQQVIDFSLNLVDHQLRPRARLLRSSDPIPLVLGNEARLGQVVLNLLVNAAQAIPEGDAQANVVSIRTFTDSRGFCVTEIIDTGSGIAPENLSRIFDPFFTTKATSNGTGLGLSICHRIVAEMGGELTVESRLGHGATFRLSLPATEERVSTASEREASPEPLRSCSILVVDDEEGILRAFQRTLDSHEVVVCQSGRAVPEIVQTQGPFDVIFCDLTMPDGTGADVYKALSKVSPEHVSRIVFMTGGVSTAEILAFLEEVPNECLEKPLGPERIRAVIAGRIFDKDKCS